MSPHFHVLDSIFNFKCPGNSSLSHTLLLYKDGHVNKEIAEVCRDRFVRVAFNQWPGTIEVDNETNAMVEYPYQPGEYAWQWEILSSFFEKHGLTPIFYDCNSNWGSLNTSTRLWNGAVGMVVYSLSF